MTLGSIFEKIAMAVFVSFVTLIAYWYFQVPRVTYEERRLNKTEFFPGEVLRVAVQSTEEPCKATVKRKLVFSTGAEQSYDDELRSNTPGYTIELPIPVVAPEGPAMYSARITRVCNPLQKYFPLEIEQPPLFFTILPVLNSELPVQQGTDRGITLQKNKKK